MATRSPRKGVVRRLAKWTLLLALGLIFLAASLLVYDSIAPPFSTLMMARTLEGRAWERRYVPLRGVAPIAVASVIASEDARFCQNDGVDWGALHEVLAEADEDGPSRGASTITMQVAKNLFLWPARSDVRKGLEIAIALALDRIWSKTRVMEAYLNIAEWGDGIFGIEAAAQRYFGKPAEQLDAREAALLAVALPSPLKRDPAHPRPLQRRLAANIVRRTRLSREWVDCFPGYDSSAPAPMVQHERHAALRP